MTNGEPSARAGVAKNKESRYLNPLSASVYFRRNPSRVLPMVFVIVLSVFLIASIATMANALDLTIRTIYGYTRFFTYVIPNRITLEVAEDQKKIIREDSRTDRVIPGSIYFMNIRTVIGQLPFVVLGMTQDDRDYLMKRVGTKIITGRLPAEGMPECALSEPIVENRRLKIGDVVVSPSDDGGIAGSPVPVRLVGVLQGPTWLALTSKTFADQNFRTLPRTVIYTTKNPADLLPLNQELMPAGKVGGGRLDRSKVRMLSYQNLVRELRDSLSTMFLVMSIVNGMVIFVISLMCGMLADIYFTQRIAEFGVLSAIGYGRGKLFLRIATETLLLTFAGWVAGAVITFFVLTYLKDVVFAPRGLIINPRDLFAYQYTIPIPFCITVFAIGAIFWRLLRLDPVSVIERR